MYSEGYTICTKKDVKFLFLIVEKTPPYAVNILQADELYVKAGLKEYRDLMSTYHTCKETDNWYGYTGSENEIGILGVPGWMKIN